MPEALPLWIIRRVLGEENRGQMEVPRAEVAVVVAAEGLGGSFDDSHEFSLFPQIGFHIAHASRRCE
jgi:hypothetical protein